MTQRTWRTHDQERWEGVRNKRPHIGYSVHCLGGGYTKTSEITTELTQVTENHLYPENY